MELPYAPRQGQAELGEAIRKAQQGQRHLLLEAGTGIGKTVVALAASLETCRSDGRRLLWACRTNSQQAQLVAEHAALLKAHWPEAAAAGAAASAAQAAEQAPLLVPFMGRRHYCPLLRGDERFADGTPEELGRLCRDAKQKATQELQSGHQVEGACPFYLRLLRDGVGPVEALLQAGGLDGGSLARRIEGAGSCPYEALKLLLPKAAAVAVPFVFLLDERLRRTLLDWMGAPASECHLVLDEAHHLPDAARGHFSPRLAAATLARALKEAEEQADPVLAGTTLASTLLAELTGAIHRLAQEHTREEDGLVPPGALDEELLARLRVATPQLQRIALDLERWGDVVREARRKQGRLPRSYLGTVGAFLQTWLGSRDHPMVQLVTGGENPALELYLLDPAPVLGWLQDFASTLHMSGTLAPLDEHRLLCGLDRPLTAQVTIPSPFPAANLRLYGLEGVHRRFDALQREPHLVARQQELAREVLERCPGRTGLFFPSHRMLKDYLEEGFLHGTDRPLFVEAPGMGQAELAALVEAFRTEPGGRGLLLAVLGGRLTEGIDFPGKAMEQLLLFGVPYPKPSARSQALIHHYDRAAGNGWMVAVHNPVGRTLRQAVGRLIRSPGDRGTAVVLDDRVVRFHSHLPGLRMVAQPGQIRLPDGGSEPEGYRTAAEILQEKPS